MLVVVCQYPIYCFTRVIAVTTYVGCNNTVLYAISLDMKYARAALALASVGLIIALLVNPTRYAQSIADGLMMYVVSVLSNLMCGKNMKPRNSHLYPTVFETTR